VTSKHSSQPEIEAARSPFLQIRERASLHLRPARQPAGSRVIDQRWRKGSTDLERVKYGYNEASNRIWRENTVASGGQDEFYQYDGLYQVSDLARGTLNGGKTGIDGTPSWEENWNFDPSGNWHGSSTAYLTKVNGSPTLDQNRQHNKANEITGITRVTGTNWPTPTHDAAGNMTLVPRPNRLNGTYQLKWDAWNRLVEVRLSSTSVLAAPISTMERTGASPRPPEARPATTITPTNGRCSKNASAPPVPPSAATSGE
jgi:hypothetical protein